MLTLQLQPSLYHSPDESIFKTTNDVQVDCFAGIRLHRNSQKGMPRMRGTPGTAGTLQIAQNFLIHSGYCHLASPVKTMPRPSKAINQRFATLTMILDELPRLPSHLRRRLEAIRILYHRVSTSDAADIARVSRRTVQRWLATWNSDGPDTLLRRVKRGPKRKICRDQFDRDLYPLLLTADGRQMSAWSLADVHRRLLKKDEIQMSYSTLRRTFRRFGYQPQAPPKKAPASLRAGRPHEWNYPWPAEYGRSMADFLQKQEMANDGNSK